MQVEQQLRDDLDGSTILGFAQEEFKKRLLSNGGLIPVECPEWNCIVYRPQAVSVNRMDRIVKAQEQGGLAYFVTLLIEVGRTHDGKTMFKNSQRETLMNGVGTDVVIRLGTEMIKSLEVDMTTIESTLTTPATTSTSGSTSPKGSATEK